MNKQERIIFLQERISDLIVIQQVRYDLGISIDGINEKIENHFKELKSLTNR